MFVGTSSCDYVDGDDKFKTIVLLGQRVKFSNDF